MSAGLISLISISLFLVYALLTDKEEKRGQRFFLVSARSFLDDMLVRFTGYVGKKFRYLVRHTIQLSWYYSIHSTLRAILTMLVKAYDSLETVFISNRERARVLRAERRTVKRDNHLTVIGEHKATTALSPSQKKKLRAKKLEGE